MWFVVTPVAGLKPAIQGPFRTQDAAALSAALFDDSDGVLVCEPQVRWFDNPPDPSSVELPDVRWLDEPRD